MQGRGLYPRTRDLHNSRGASLLFRLDAETPQADLSSTMVVLRTDMIRTFPGASLTRGKVGGAVEEMKREWKKWNRHINAVVWTAYNEEVDQSAVMLGIMYPRRLRGLLRSPEYTVLDYGEDE